MKRILFVDDETHVLDGIRRALRPERHEFDMVFATSGEEALALCEESSFDIIVSDMNMPCMSGAELLEKMHQLHPNTIRFILSGFSDLEAVMRTVPVAHQFLAKPCSSKDIRDVVVAACHLQQLLEDERLLRIVGGVETLPSRPELYSRILAAIADPDSCLADIAAIVESDTAMSAKLLQLSNSSFFGVAQEIKSLEQATTYLGVNTIRDLVLSLEVFRSPEGCGRELEVLFDDVHLRSSRTAALARRMFTDKRKSADAFTAGILHDIGTLILAWKLPEESLEILEMARVRGVPVRVAEEEVLGVTHAELGAHLLSLWGLPYSMISAAAYHHRPSVAPPASFNELAAVHVAGALIEARSPGIEEGHSTPIDLDLLETLGVSEQLESWEQLADEIMESGEPT